MNYTDPSGHCINADGSINWNSSNGPFGTSGLCNVDTSTVDPILGNPVSPDITDPGGVASTAGWDPDPGRSFAEIIYDLSITTQNLATGFSTMGMEIEIGVGVVGCVLGAEQGVIPGCLEGLAMGNQIHRKTTGEIEEFFSFISLVSTSIYGFLEHTSYIDYDEKVLVIDESTATSISAALLGGSNIGTVDYFVDSYASSYNEGNQPGIYEIIENRGVEVYGTRIAIYNLATVNHEEKKIWGWIQFGESK